MNRRDLLKSIVALPIAARMTAEPEILYAHVEETPWLRKRVRVLVNGVELKKCVWADVRKGCAQAIATHSDGRPIIGNGKCLKHFVYGEIRIERIA